MIGWQRPWPSWKLIAASETTQLIGTLAAVYAWLITPIGWRYALLVWVYWLAGFLANGGFTIIAYALLQHRGPQEAAHLARVEGSLVSHVPRTR